MIRRPITYTNFNNETVTEDYFFNLSRSELIELEMSHEGGLEQWIQNIVQSGDGNLIMAEFKKIILKSFGTKSPDGRRFLKLQVEREDFESSGAYDELFMQLVTDAEKAAEFVQGIMPRDLMQEAQIKMGIDNIDELKPNPQEPQPEWVPPSEPREISRVEADAMDAAELSAGLASKTLVIIPPDPQALTQADMTVMDIGDLTNGLQSGRYKLSTEA